MRVSEFLGKKVLDKNAMEIGKVSDVDLMPKEGIINSFTVSTGDIWLRNKNFEFKSGDIIHIGDYVILDLEDSSIVEIEEETEEGPKKTRLNLPK